MNIVSVQRALESCVDDEREYRFAAWKNKMADDKAALAWLRRQPQVVSPAVCVNKRDPVASSVQEAIRNIVIFRYRIWHRTPVDMDVVWPQVIQQALICAEQQMTAETGHQTDGRPLTCHFFLMPPWIAAAFAIYFYAGIKGRGTDDAIAPLLHMARKGWLVGTLDLRKAFDTASPQLAGQIFHRIGMPQNVLAPTLDVWSDQQKWHEGVSHRLPQSDSWSMLGISALLIPAAIAVQQEFVSVTQVLYADDRNFAVDNAHDAVRITERWQQWASLLGLQENADKAQFWHQAAAGRRKLLEAGCLETQVSGEKSRAARMTVCPKDGRQHSDKECWT
ncbi:unnamed protein product [Cladocopium goreaui]|uniref:Retrovirus-related Pol polyprotein from transposon TNT 1-94 n=1 Tax=Cladocopium goreaui TaxID=2562237 RepID=A0A9P1DA17_9DINO|nr:unnamed protein product [Cladocopium goreaui]